MVLRFMLLSSLSLDSFIVLSEKKSLTECAHFIFCIFFTVVDAEKEVCKKIYDYLQAPKRRECRNGVDCLWMGMQDLWQRALLTGAGDPGEAGKDRDNPVSDGKPYAFRLALRVVDRSRYSRPADRKRFGKILIGHIRELSQDADDAVFQRCTICF